jgi:hypothetical protein
MRILILHQNAFDRYDYPIAIDHEQHDVTYAGLTEHISTIPAHIRCTTMRWDASLPVQAQLQAWMQTQAPFDRIITRIEALIMPAALLRQQFSIPGMQPEVALNFRDKVHMKHTLDGAGIRIPRFLAATDGRQEAPWTGKTIVKPRDGMGSQGVTLFDTYDAARSFIAQQCQMQCDFVDDQYEVEEYLEGEIWHIDGFMYQGQMVAIQSSYYIGTCMQYQVDALPLGSVQQDNPELDAWTHQCLLALGADTLTFHMEAIMTDDGPAFLEAAARCGGAYVADTFLLKHGINLHTVDIASEVDGALATRFACKSTSARMYGWFLHPGHAYDGARCEVRVSSATLQDPSLVSYTMLSAGTPTRKLANYRPDYLPFSAIVSSEDSASLAERIRRLQREITVVPLTEAAA